MLRRVHAPENAKDKKGEIKMFGRMLAKIAAANPLAVAQLVIAQVRMRCCCWCQGLETLQVACSVGAAVQPVACYELAETRSRSTWRSL